MRGHALRGTRLMSPENSQAYDHEPAEQRTQDGVGQQLPGELQHRSQGYAVGTTGAAPGSEAETRGFIHRGARGGGQGRQKSEQRDACPGIYGHAPASAKPPPDTCVSLPMEAVASCVPMLSSHLVRSVLDSAPDAMIIIDSGGRILFANKQVEALFDHVAADLLGQNVEI